MPAPWCVESESAEEREGRGWELDVDVVVVVWREERGGEGARLKAREWRDGAVSEGQLEGLEWEGRNGHGFGGGRRLLLFFNLGVLAIFLVLGLECGDLCVFARPVRVSILL